MRFFETYIGMYVVQTVVHSMVTLLIVEMAMRIWGVESAHERFRYRLVVLALPFFMYPSFQYLNPERGMFYFIQDDALFSSMRWLKMQVFGRRPFEVAFLALVGAVSAVVALQEVVPIVRDWFGSGRAYPGTQPPAGVDAVVAEMSRRAGIAKPSVVVVEDGRPFLFASGTKNHSIVMSRGLLDNLDARQLRNALGHEIAHIVRRSNATTLLAFLVRIVMFYNPVSLFQFRRLVQDDEHICDDMTVGITGDPEGLASALRLFWLDIPQQEKIALRQVKDVIEHSSHNLLLHERIVRLEGRRDRERGGGWFGLGMTVAACVAVNYFVV